MRVRVEGSRCSGHGLCHAVDPLLFPLGANGHSVLEPREVQPQELALTREGVGACPDLALILEEGD